MADISKIKLPNGNTYDIKDIIARERGIPAGGNGGQVLSKIDGTDYNTEWIDPPSGGGGGIGYTKTILWSGYKADTGTITLNDSVKNYDIVLIKVTSHPNQPSSNYYESYFTVLPNEIVYNQTAQYCLLAIRATAQYGDGSMDCHFSSPTSFVIETISITVGAQTKPAVLEIIGLKFGGAGADGSGYRVDLLYENTDFSVASGTGYVSLDYTLSASIDDYDAVIVSAFMVNKETTREQVETIIINKSQYYTRAVSSGTDDYNTRWAFTLNGNYLLGSQSILRSLYFGFADSTTLKTLSRRSNSGEEPKLYKVYGLKLSTTETAFIYSNEERVVGVWTDNKPLYQKVYTLDNSVEIPSSRWYTTTIPTNNIETIVDVTTINTDGTIWKFLAASVSNTNYVKLFQTRGDNIGVKTIILQYTKTTDTPGSGPYVTSGSYAHHYSTEEQVVGTWIDGSTLYEKTQYGGITFSTQGTWYDTNITNIDKIVSVEGSINRDGDPIDIGYWASSIVSDWVLRDHTLKVKMERMVSSETYTLNNITVRYTKTS